MSEEKEKAAYVGKLDTLSGVRKEAARLYRLARAGKIGSLDAWRQSAVLSLVGKLVEAELMEARVARLEARVARQGASRSLRPLDTRATLEGRYDA